MDIRNSRYWTVSIRGKHLFTTEPAEGSRVELVRQHMIDRFPASKGYDIAEFFVVRKVTFKILEND